VAGDFRPGNFDGHGAMPWKVASPSLPDPVSARCASKALSCGLRTCPALKAPFFAPERVDREGTRPVSRSREVASYVCGDDIIHLPREAVFSACEISEKHAGPKLKSCDLRGVR
jgi:hypothetical protein